MFPLRQASRLSVNIENPLWGRFSGALQISKLAQAGGAIWRNNYLIKPHAASD